MATKAELEARIAELENGPFQTWRVTAVSASIAVEWREVGGVRVGLDAGGEAVDVMLPDRAYGWEAE